MFTVYKNFSYQSDSVVWNKEVSPCRNDCWKNRCWQDSYVENITAVSYSPEQRSKSWIQCCQGKCL